MQLCTESVTIAVMTTRITPDETSARRQIDVAVEILIGRHGYSSDDAFDALARHALVHSVGLLPTARAVVDAAQGRIPGGAAVYSLLNQPAAAA